MTKQEFEIKAREFKKVFGFNPPVSRFLLFCGTMSLDLIELSDTLPNYDGDKFKYKGKPNYSLEMAIEEEYGKEGIKLIREMVK